MKITADAKQREVIHQPGDWVMLKLRPHRKVSAKGPQPIMGKLAKRFYGPFQVLEHIGPVAYCLKLLEEVRIHPVFHRSQLKAFKGSPEHIQEVHFPKQFVQHQPVITPLASHIRLSASFRTRALGSVGAMGRAIPG